MKLNFKFVSLIILTLILAVVALPNTLAVEKVISNSADWKDVYSATLYASLIDKQPGLFLTSTRHGTTLLYSVPLSTNGTLIVSSRTQPYVVNYKSVMTSQGYTNVEELIVANPNLELAKRLDRDKIVTKYIIVDDAYGYNALSAAAYAVVDKHYVLFANERNIGAIDSFLSDANPSEVIIFGQVDEAVKTRLAEYNPITINKGDRFDNNIEMIKLYQKVRNSKQLLMSNGEFIESSIMSGDDPVIFIGRGTVPIQIQEYIKESEFQVAVLIGNELVNSATTIRRQLGISVFVKFAQGSRAPSGPIATVEDLDKFPMPRYGVDIEVYSIMYNIATKQLWVTYRNKANIGTFLKGTITVTSGTQTIVVGDNDPVFLDKNQYKTILYDAQIEGQNITAKLYTLFGEGRRSMEYVLEAEVPVESIEILDDALINITNVEYDKGKDRFIITVENIGTVDTYVSLELIDLFINGEYIIVSSPEAILLKPQERVKIPVEIELSDSDIENSPIIKVKGYYGERENSLIKSVYGEYAFKLVAFDIVTYSLILLIIILLLLILFGKKKCPHCKTKNSRFAKTCKKCGGLLKDKTHRAVHHHKHEEHKKQETTDNTSTQSTANSSSNENNNQ